jgi:hypothetical protein
MCCNVALIQRVKAIGLSGNRRARTVRAFHVNIDRGNAVNFLIELWKFLRSRKKLWLLPIMIVMLLLGGLLILAQGSAVAPFIYTLF